MSVCRQKARLPNDFLPFTRVTIRAMATVTPGLFFSPLHPPSAFYDFGAVALVAHPASASFVLDLANLAPPCSPTFALREEGFLSFVKGFSPIRRYSEGRFLTTLASCPLVLRFLSPVFTFLLMDHRRRTTSFVNPNCGRVRIRKKWKR